MSIEFPSRPSLYRRSRMVALRSVKSALEAARNLFASPCDAPLFVFGNQKSGTTAIAALLSRATGLPATLDFYGAREPHLGRLLRGELSIDRFVAVNSYPFSKAIVKEPNLTFVAARLLEYFGCNKAVFVIRDPRTNIRSALNRLSIRGDLNSLSLDDTWLPNETWRSILEGGHLNFEDRHYVDVLAHRWNATSAVYFASPESFSLVRYEDFVEDKIGTIKSLASSLGLEIINDLIPYVDVQYQSASDKSVSVEAFFGEQNLLRINSLCSEYMGLARYR